MAQLHHLESSSQHSLEEYGSSYGKQCHGHEEEHNSSIDVNFATTPSCITTCALEDTKQSCRNKLLSVSERVRFRPCIYVSIVVSTRTSNHGGKAKDKSNFVDKTLLNFEAAGPKGHMHAAHCMATKCGLEHVLGAHSISNCGENIYALKSHFRCPSVIGVIQQGNCMDQSRTRKRV
jgi:hypothetical protein